MLKLKDGLLLNESQVIAAEFVAQGENKTLKLTLTASVNFAQQVEGNPNQILLTGNEAESVWRVLSKDAHRVEPPPTSSASSYAVAGKGLDFDMK
jgi:hypothetical protein